MQLNIQDTFNVELPADPIEGNFVRQVPEACFSFVKPTPCGAPVLLHHSPEMLEALGLQPEDARSETFLGMMSGNDIYPGTHPYAMRYGGHQFGVWAGQLGDGRAINLCEVTHKGRRWALQLKGAGRTPYSRSADGLAVLRSSVREYLCSEAMRYLGVPTTRALSLTLTGDEVLRDMFYDGRPAYEKGAIVCRVAPTFIRFGNFQIFAAQEDMERLKQLTDYTLRHFFPELGEPSKTAYLAFLKEVAQRTMRMVVEWERVGFVHGVMNTDNMSILGLTIDYGPYGWLEEYDPNWTPNTTDAQGRRYRFGNQADVALWNLYQLANALVPLIDDIESMKALMEEVVQGYYGMYESMMLQKLGLKTLPADPEAFFGALENTLHQSRMDMTIFYRKLAAFDPDDSESFLEALPEYSYASSFTPFKTAWKNWLERYAEALRNDPNPERAADMNAVNPKYVLRNYMAQRAIEAADEGDYGLIDELFRLLQRPYDEQPDMEHWFAKRPEWARNKAGCSMLSCSS